MLINIADRCILLGTGFDLDLLLPEARPGPSGADRTETYEKHSHGEAGGFAALAQLLPAARPSGQELRPGLPPRGCSTCILRVQEQAGHIDVILAFQVGAVPGVASPHYWSRLAVL